MRDGLLSLLAAPDLGVFVNLSARKGAFVSSVSRGNRHFSSFFSMCADAPKTPEAISHNHLPGVLPKLTEGVDRAEAVVSPNPLPVVLPKLTKGAPISSPATPLGLHGLNLLSHYLRDPMSNLKTQTPGDIVQLEALRRDYADLGKSRQSVEPPEITACGIRLLSRDGCGVEMIEMLSFARRLAALGLHPFVGSVFYDSNSCLAVLEIDSKVTPGSTVAGSIYSIAEDTLSQFEWLDGTVRSATD